MTLEAIYAAVPSIKCQRKCQEACGPIGMSLTEGARLKAKGPICLHRLLLFPEAFTNEALPA
jgi:hypothetical protein